MRFGPPLRAALRRVGLDVRRVRTYSLTQRIMVRNEQDDARLNQLLVAALRSGSCCVDVGAHTGSITEQFLRLAPAGRHIAVEPIPELAAGLRAAHPEVQVLECAVGASAGRVKFSYVPEASFLSGIDTTALDSYDQTLLDVELRTIDDIVGGNRVDLLKIDVEGAELDVLRGARATLEAQHPIVVFEHTRVRFGAGLVAELGPLDRDLHDGLFTLLSGDLGYRIFDLEGAGPLDRAEFWRLYESAERFNFIAVP